MVLEANLRVASPCTTNTTPRNMHMRGVTQDHNVLSLQYFTPRMRGWVGNLPFPADQRSAVARALEDNGYTSMAYIVGEDVQQLLGHSLIAALTPGARAAVRKLAESTVRCLPLQQSITTVAVLHCNCCSALPS